MPIFILVAIGFALMFGHRDLAKSLVKPFIGLILVLSFLPLLLGWCGSAAKDVALPVLPSTDHAWMLGPIALAAIGYVLWRRRDTEHGGNHHKTRLSPRRRALPPPPDHDAW